MSAEMCAFKGNGSRPLASEPRRCVSQWRAVAYDALRHDFVNGLLSVATITKECGMPPGKRQHACAAAEAAKVADIRQMGHQHRRPLMAMHENPKFRLTPFAMSGVSHREKASPRKRGGWV